MFYKLTILKNSSVPIYEQIRHAIQNLIKNGDLKPGDIIPSENKLAEMYGISRMTARNAIKELAREGFVICVPGKGTFVGEPEKKEVDASRVDSFTEIAKKFGFVPGGRVLVQREVEPTGKAAKFLALPEGENAIEIERVRTLDDIPVLLTKAFFPVRLCRGLAEYDLTDTSIYKVLEEKFGFRPSRGRQYMQACNVPRSVASILEVEPGTAVIYWERELYLDNGTPIEYSSTYVGTNQFKLCSEVQNAISHSYVASE